MDPKTLALLDHRHLWHPFTQQAEWVASAPLIVAEADGVYLIDVHGRRYLDGVSSLWTNVHGHRVPELDRALQEQLGRVAHSTMLGLTHPSAIALAARLAELSPGELVRTFYSDNGSTAVEVALKMAFQSQQQRGEHRRTRFATLRDAYHGDTLGAVSVGSIELFHAIYRPLLFDAISLPAPTSPGGPEEEEALSRGLQLLEEHGDTLAAFVFEPLVQGAAGMKMHSASFLRALAQRARELGVLLVADEVAVGLGRTGSLFAMEQVGLAPDLLCLAKGLAGGYLPLAATLCTESIYQAFLGAPEAHRQFFHGHTFTGNPLAAAVALASLERIEAEDVLAQADALAGAMSAALDELSSLPWVSRIRRRGVMVGIDLSQPDGSSWAPSARVAHRVAMATRPRGAIVRPLGDTIVLNPPLVMSPDQGALLVQIVGEAVAEVCG
ncbi:MAG TPA: adenosylmethionine--8-amino-7-oxononanoate transaminase [Deltaproteobacteria bacterium]|nr:adenosylmethionine--8-amino-7-oxononanoate transaminase [Deltaproteobacteria bacterium]